MGEQHDLSQRGKKKLGGRTEEPNHGLGVGAELSVTRRGTESSVTGRKLKYRKGGGNRVAIPHEILQTRREEKVEDTLVNVLEQVPTQNGEKQGPAQLRKGL